MFVTQTDRFVVVQKLPLAPLFAAATHLIDFFFFVPCQGFPDSILDCRACDSSQTVHPECWPIPVPKNDPYFPALNTSSGRPHCIAFTRSLPGQQRLGPREQLNQNTAFIDASMVYGNDVCMASDLRELSGGRLNGTLPVHGRGKHLVSD